MSKWKEGDSVIEVCQCPIHKDFIAIMVGEFQGGGTRMFGTKCCGQWRTLKQWRPTANEWRELERAAIERAEEADAREAKEGSDAV